MLNLELYKNKKKQLKLTNQKIAEITGIPKRTIEDFFCGASKNPRIDTVQAIETALGLNQQPEWTNEEKDLGVGRHKTYLSEDEYEWLELRSLIIKAHGEKYLNTVIAMLTALIKK